MGEATRVWFWLDLGVARQAAHVRDRRRRTGPRSSGQGWRRMSTSDNAWKGRAGLGGGASQRTSRHGRAGGAARLCVRLGPSRLGTAGVDRRGINTPGLSRQAGHRSSWRGVTRHDNSRLGRRRSECPEPATHVTTRTGEAGHARRGYATQGEARLVEAGGVTLASAGQGVVGRGAAGVDRRVPTERRKARHDMAPQAWQFPSAEQLIATYLRARGILNDGTKVLSAPIQPDWIPPQDGATVPARPTGMIQCATPMRFIPIEDDPE